MHWKFFILFSILLTSCVEISNHEFLSEVETLISEVDSLESKYRTTHIDNIKSIKLWSDSMDLKIRRLFKPVPFEVGKKITAFAEVKNDLEPFETSDSIIKNTLIHRKTQLIHLKSDIENGSGKRGHYQDYIGAEKLKVDSLKFLVYQRDSVRIRIISTFNELEYSLDSNLNEIFLRE